MIGQAKREPSERQDALAGFSPSAGTHQSLVTNHLSLLFPLVPELKSDDRCESISTWRRRQFRDLLTGFSYRLINDRIARAVNDREFCHASIRLNLETDIDYDSCTGRDFPVWLVPGALKPILDDLSVETDIGFTVAGGGPMFLSFAVPGSGLLMPIRFSAAVPFAAVLL